MLLWLLSFSRFDNAHAVTYSSVTELLRNYACLSRRYHYYLLIDSVSLSPRSFPAKCKHTQTFPFYNEITQNNQPPWTHTFSLDFGLSRTIVINVFLHIPQLTSFWILHENDSKLGCQITSTMLSPTELFQASSLGNLATLSGAVLFIRHYFPGLHDPILSSWFLLSHFLLFPLSQIVLSLPADLSYRILSVPRPHADFTSEGESLSLPRVCLPNVQTELAFPSHQAGWSVVVPEPLSSQPSDLFP